MEAALQPEPREVMQIQEGIASCPRLIKASVAFGVLFCGPSCQRAQGCTLRAVLLSFGGPFKEPVVDMGLYSMGVRFLIYASSTRPLQDAGDPYVGQLWA